MIDQTKKTSPESEDHNEMKMKEKVVQSSRKGPLSFLSGALTSFFFAWLSFLLSRKVVIYFVLHSPNYTSQFAQSIASAMKTLAIGMCFLATFTFAFIGLGLSIVFIRSLFPDKVHEDD